MGVSAPPAWANVTSKPTTVAGFGITDAVHADNGYGAVGSFAWGIHTTSGTSVTAGTTYAGSALAVSGFRIDVSASPWAFGGGVGLSGTWRCLGSSTAVAGSYSVSLFQRIS